MTLSTGKQMYLINYLELKLSFILCNQMKKKIHKNQNNTNPSPGCTTIALGFSRFSQMRTFRCRPSRSETSIRDVPESVQNRLLWIQSTATPPGEKKCFNPFYSLNRMQKYLSTLNFGQINFFKSMYIALFITT